MAINEKELNDYPKPIFFEATKKILDQMKKCICQIIDGANRGTGFFAKLFINGKLVKVFITNNHVINKHYLETKKEIIINIYDKPKEIKIKGKVFITEEENDVTIIEVSEKEEIYDYLELDDYIFHENRINEYIGNSVYLLQYPSYNGIQKLAVSYGIIKGSDEKKKFNFQHYCCTNYGSSGSPILNINNNKIIGIHTKRAEKNNYNYGTFLIYALNQFIEAYKSKNFNKVNIIDATRNINKTYKYYNNNKNVNSGLARYRIRKSNSPTQNISDNYQSKINTETKRSTSQNSKTRKPPNNKIVNMSNDKKEEGGSIIKKEIQFDIQAEIQFNIKAVIQSNIKKEEAKPIIKKEIQFNIQAVIKPNIKKEEAKPIIKKEIQFNIQAVIKPNIKIEEAIKNEEAQPNIKEIRPVVRKKIIQPIIHEVIRSNNQTVQQIIEKEIQNKIQPIIHKVIQSNIQKLNMPNINKEETQSINKEVIKQNNKKVIKSDVLTDIKSNINTKCSIIKTKVIPYINKNESKLNLKPVIQSISIQNEIKTNHKQEPVQPKINPIEAKSNSQKVIPSIIQKEIPSNFPIIKDQYDFHKVNNSNIHIEEIPKIPQIIPKVIQQDLQPINLHDIQSVFQEGEAQSNINKQILRNSPKIQKIVQQIIINNIQNVFIEEIQPIIIEIIQPLYYINKKQFINNSKSIPISSKNKNILEYPLNDMNKKYLQNIDLSYIEMQFRNTEQEYLKNDNAILEKSTTRGQPIYEPTNYNNNDIIVKNNLSRNPNVINEILPQQIKIIEYTKKIKYAFHKYIEIILIEDNSI